jgi:sugar lactone lactonase YvrE
VSTHADLGACTDTSLNDMVVDGRGRAWVGCFGFDLMAFADPQLAPLMRIDPDGTATIAAEELTFPNGSVITPDGNTLIVGETAGCRYTAFRIAPGGAIVEEIPTPEGLGCYACALGGDDGRTLLVCAAPDFLEANRRQAREAVLLTATVDVPHAGLP